MEEKLDQARGKMPVGTLAILDAAWTRSWQGETLGLGRTRLEMPATQSYLQLQEEVQWRKWEAA